MIAYAKRLLSRTQYLFPIRSSAVRHRKHNKAFIVMQRAYTNKSLQTLGLSKY